MSESLAENIGAVARAAREQMGLTQAEVAQRVELAHLVYSRLERGKMLPSVPTLVRLCLALQLSPEEALGLSTASPSPEGRHPREAALRRLLFLARGLEDDMLDTVVTLATTLHRYSSRPPTSASASRSRPAATRASPVPRAKSRSRRTPPGRE